MDLAFAISALPRDRNFGLILDIVKEVTERFFSDRVQYGLIVFGRDALIRIHFRDKYRDPKKLQTFIGSVASNDDEPALDKALIKAKLLFESEFARKDAQKVGILGFVFLFFFLSFFLSCYLFTCPFRINKRARSQAKKKRKKDKQKAPLLCLAFSAAIFAVCFELNLTWTF